jgi:hypothetical protein
MAEAAKKLQGFVGQNHRINAVAIESGIVIVQHRADSNLPATIDYVKNAE